jgi:hypothetical protein
MFLSDSLATRVQSGQREGRQRERERKKIADIIKDEKVASAEKAQSCHAQINIVICLTSSKIIIPISCRGIVCAQRKVNPESRLLATLLSRPA